MAEETINRFNLFTEKLLHSNLINFEDFHNNKEITDDRVEQLLYDKLTSKQVAIVRNRFKDNYILNYIDMIYFDVLDIARPKKIKLRLDSGFNIFEILHDTNLKMEIILFILENFHEDDNLIRGFMIEHIQHLNNNYGWLTTYDISDEIKCNNLSEDNTNKAFELLETYKIILNNIRVYYTWYTTPPSFQLTSEVKPNKYEYKYIKPIELIAE